MEVWSFCKSTKTLRPASEMDRWVQWLASPQQRPLMLCESVVTMQNRLSPHRTGIRLRFVTAEARVTVGSNWLTYDVMAVSYT
jgi:hypothetical protein